MAEIFEWQAPPPKLTGRSAKAMRIAKSLARKPNEWAAVAVYADRATAHDRASDIRTGKVKGYNIVGKFETMVRETPEGYKVFVRCVHINKEMIANVHD